MASGGHRELSPDPGKKKSRPKAAPCASEEAQLPEPTVAVWARTGVGVRAGARRATCTISSS